MIRTGRNSILVMSHCPGHPPRALLRPCPDPSEPVTQALGKGLGLSFLVQLRIFGRPDHCKPNRSTTKSGTLGKRQEPRRKQADADGASGGEGKRGANRGRQGRGERAL